MISIFGLWRSTRAFKKMNKKVSSDIKKLSEKSILYPDRSGLVLPFVAFFCQKGAQISTVSAM